MLSEYKSIEQFFVEETIYFELTFFGFFSVQVTSNIFVWGCFLEDSIFVMWSLHGLYQPLFINQMVSIFVVRSCIFDLAYIILSLFHYKDEN